jgi:hypothetical protein
MRSSDFTFELDLHVRDLLRGDAKRLEAYGKQRDGTATPNKAFAAGDPLWIIFYKAQAQARVVGQFECQEKNIPTHSN